MANVTGSWQHYSGFILSKRAPPQGWNKKPRYVILWNGKMTEKQAREFRPRCKLNVHNSLECFDPSSRKGCAARLRVGQGRCHASAGRVRPEGVPAEPGHPHSYARFEWTPRVRANFLFPQLLPSRTPPSPSCPPLNISSCLWLFHFSPSLDPKSSPLGYSDGLSSCSLMLLSHCFHALVMFTSE